MIATAVSLVRIAPRVGSAVVFPVFAWTLLLSAGLMFLVEPMVAKIVLPRLGGAATVWSTCLVFFQIVLLLGYAYAYVSARFLPRMAQVVLHLCVLMPLAALVLPLNLGTSAPPSDHSPVLWLLLRLTLGCGPPVLIISATAPLLQNWFTAAGHRSANDPYFLYAVSNGGSLLALIAYPFIVEPELSLQLQATLWSFGFGLLGFGIALCAAATLSHERRSALAMAVQARTTVRARDRLLWTLLAFVPSSMLLGVTAHITADITSAPLLWVVPLSLYLLTFIFVFARRPLFSHAIMVRVLPILVIPVVLTVGLAIPPPLSLTLHLGCFFVVGMVCHGELARRRPSTAQLTEFYFYLSVGGVLGGVFNALLAPVIFPDVWEYPVALVAACLLKPTTSDAARRSIVWDLVLPIMLLPAVVLNRSALTSSAGTLSALSMLLLVLMALALLNFSPRRWRFGLAIALLLVIPMVPPMSNLIATERSFFGVYHLGIANDGHTQFMVLNNGTTLHGVESLVPSETRVPMAYYSKEGPFGRFFTMLPQGSIKHVGVVGLGTGELACYANEGQDWTFYEIDPMVERIARDARYFQFLTSCGSGSQVVLGDARMTIGNARDGSYDLLIIDAFSSDSIPMHLLTREALALYLRKLASGGWILFHISSRTLNLAPVIGALAADAGVPARILLDSPPPETSVWRRASAQVVAVAGPGSDLSHLTNDEAWRGLPPARPEFLWTDQRADLLRVIRLGW